MDAVNPGVVSNEDRPIGLAIPADDSPPRWLEVGCLLVIVVLADFCIYRGQGYAGWAAFLRRSLFCYSSVRPSGDPERALACWERWSH